MSRKKKLRVLVLMHEDLVPPDDLDDPPREDILQFKTEYDVVTGLERLGHEVHKLGVWDELAPLRKALQEGDPDIVFNLLEEFHGQAVYDHNVVSYLELMRTPYTGCNPRGLVLARDKALSKKILHYHRIRVPRFAVVPLDRKFRRPQRLDFPLIVKSLVEEASTGISRASVVHDEDKLSERIRFIHQHVRTDAIVERYIEGRELYVGVMGNQRLTVLRGDADKLDPGLCHWLLCYFPSPDEVTPTDNALKRYRCFPIWQPQFHIKTHTDFDDFIGGEAHAATAEVLAEGMCQRTHLDRLHYGAHP